MQDDGRSQGSQRPAEGRRRRREAHARIPRLCAGRRLHDPVGACCGAIGFGLGEHLRPYTYDFWLVLEAIGIAGTAIITWRAASCIEPGRRRFVYVRPVVAALVMIGFGTLWVWLAHFGGPRAVRVLADAVRRAAVLFRPVGGTHAVRRRGGRRGADDGGILLVRILVRPVARRHLRRRADPRRRVAEALTWPTRSSTSRCG